MIGTIWETSTIKMTKHHIKSVRFGCLRSKQCGTTRHAFKQCDSYRIFSDRQPFAGQDWWAMLGCWEFQDPDDLSGHWSDSNMLKHANMYTYIYFTYNTCICSPELLTRQDLPFYVYIVRIWAIKKQIARSCCKLGPLVQYEDKSSLTSCLENIISPYISHGFLGEQWYPHIFSIYVPIYIILVSSMSNICFRDRSGGRCCGGSCIAATQRPRGEEWLRLAANAINEKNVVLGFWPKNMENNIITYMYINIYIYILWNWVDHTLPNGFI